jgi:hypothetical protein
MNISSLFFGPRSKTISEPVPVLPSRPNDISLENIAVLRSDKDIVMLLGEQFIYSYKGGPELGKYFFDYIRLSGDDAEAVEEVARKIIALRDLRRKELRTYETVLYDIVVLQSDNETIMNIVDGFYGGPESNGKYSYEYLTLRGKTEAEVEERVNKVQALHNLRAKEDRDLTLAKIAELNL